jgi:hypothetical protein
MPDLITTTAMPAAASATGTDFSTHPALNELIGNRWNYQQIAAALGCTERAIYMLVDRYSIPYIRVLNRRYVEPKAIREALLRDQINTPPRGRGRPKKAA